MGVPITTHQWLQPLYKALNGLGLRPLNLGSPTGIIGFYGATGVGRIATGTNPSTFGASSVAASGAIAWVNGSTGTYYTLGDVVLQLKNMGILKP